MVEILNEFEGLSKNKLKMVLRKADNCGFNTIFNHLQVHVTTLNRELTIAEMAENALDLQPVQQNSIYIKCGVLKSLRRYEGNGDPQAVNLLAKAKQHSFIARALRVDDGSKKFTSIIPTESPVEDELLKFPLSVKENIEFRSTKGVKIGWYNKNTNILWICDVTHTPMRAEMLLDKVLSAVYELQRCNSLGVLTPIHENFLKVLEKKGYKEANLYWTGFETSHDVAYVDGKLNAHEFIEEEMDNLIKAGVDIFFLRALLQKERLSLAVEKCKGKLHMGSEDTIQVPPHTTAEQEVDALESYVSDYTKTLAKEFYNLASQAINSKRIQR